MKQQLFSRCCPSVLLNCHAHDKESENHPAFKRTDHTPEHMFALNQSCRNPCIRLSSLRTISENVLQLKRAKEE